VLGWGFLALLPDRAAQEEYKKLLKEVETWLATGPKAPARAMVLVDDPAPYQPRVFLRGNPNRLGEEVSRRFLSRLDSAGQPFSRGSGRLELAEKIVDPTNPLTARVIVNRLWMHHFGAGLAATTSDFGLRGEPPSHLELLNWLASELVESGWSLKHIQRLIVTSAVFRQSSAASPSAERDVENRLLWRMNRRRLSFEAFRDALVAASGDLDERLGGPPADLFAGAFLPRRTIYGFIDRLDTPGLLTTFDFPSPLSSAPRRDATIVAPQALYLMNNDFLVEAAKRLAGRTEISDSSPAARIARMYAIVLGRAPSGNELAAATEFLGAEPAPEAWEQFAQALFMTSEFAFVD
jgi:hypothetical protein